jgi:hypothetical protein
MRVDGVSFAAKAVEIANILANRIKIVFRRDIGSLILSTFEVNNVCP